MPNFSSDNAKIVHLYHTSDKPPPSRAKLIYDVLMLVAICVDLLVLLFDNIVMSGFVAQMVSWFDWGHVASWLSHYKMHTHPTLELAGGIFTLFLVLEILWRWALAVYRKVYSRWFFFPFVHWYEVLGCLPWLRPLRLLRALVLVRRLHMTGVQIIPATWLTTAKFYGERGVELLSERVMLRVLSNAREQIRNRDIQSLASRVLDDNRAQIEQVVYRLLAQEVTPRLNQIVSSEVNAHLAEDIGQAVAQALSETPELRRYLRLIPIAGTMIEGQIVDVGRHIGEQVTRRVNERLLSMQTLDLLMANIAKGVGEANLTDPALLALIERLVNDSLSSIEAQITAPPR